jgi:hypothetical protein
MNTSTDTNPETIHVPCQIILTSEPFFVAVGTEQLDDGSLVPAMRSDGGVELKAVPPCPTCTEHVASGAGAACDCDECKLRVLGEAERASYQGGNSTPPH